MIVSSLKTVTDAWVHKNYARYVGAACQLLLVCSTILVWGLRPAVCSRGCPLTRLHFVKELQAKKNYDSVVQPFVFQ